MEFSDKIRSLRLQAGFTQSELADKLSVSRQAVSNYEQGRGYPSMDILIAMSKLFEVGLDELLDSGYRKSRLKWILIAISAVMAACIVNLFVAFYLPRERESESNLVILVLMGCSYMIPFAEMFFGILYQFAPPKKINRLYGYRTKSSMKNQMTWDYAQTYCGYLFLLISIGVCCVSMLYAIISVFVALENALVIGCCELAVSVSSLLVPVVLVEKKLKVFQ